MRHTDSDTPVRWIPAAQYVARHRARGWLLGELHAWVRAGDWRLLVAALACLVAAALVAVLL